MSNETGITVVNIQCQDIKIVERRTTMTTYKRKPQDIDSEISLPMALDYVPKSQLQNQIKQRGGAFFGQKVPMAGEATKHLSLITAQQYEQQLIQGTSTQQSNVLVCDFGNQHNSQLRNSNQLQSFNSKTRLTTNDRRMTAQQLGCLSDSEEQKLPISHQK